MDGLVRSSEQLRTTALHFRLPTSENQKAERDAMAAIIRIFNVVIKPIMRIVSNVRRSPELLGMGTRPKNVCPKSPAAIGWGLLGKR